jgi:hypothetical protein
VCAWGRRVADPVVDRRAVLVEAQADLAGQEAVLLALAGGAGAPQLEQLIGREGAAEQFDLVDVAAEQCSPESRAVPPDGEWGTVGERQWVRGHEAIEVAVECELRGAIAIDAHGDEVPLVGDDRQDWRQVIVVCAIGELQAKLIPIGCFHRGRTNSRAAT